MAKKIIIFLAIAVLYGFTPWFSWLKSDYPQKFCEYTGT